MSRTKWNFVKKLIKSDDVVIFSKSYCRYCKLTKDIFKDLDRRFTAIELDSRSDSDEIQTILGDMTGERTVPRVFVHGEFIGGAADVKELYENGQLERYFD
ncbi:hypothetical protein MTP99_018452 [Tenebrio molitor]|jgi:glutaredoxin 3|uniref:Glutaredoxin-2, mitochondrial n=1 Tax=Tenebrio molitor TaxID=7067 RepID=A0A8J6L6Q2_TENMO|nr:hypothetical protein GEV33_014297 [Tenebrio molitor]KAJ3624861.1 hypothetical protein MTP99_018452 [Tenebrio molitor]CAH1377040.1 unnamed protein product [Tenebrio molitor]